MIPLQDEIYIFQMFVKSSIALEIVLAYRAPLNIFGTWPGALLRVSDNAGYG